MMGKSFIFQSTFKNTQRGLFFLVFIIVAMYSYFTIVVK